MKRKICIITGSRAEYGLLKPLIDEIKGDVSLHLQLIVTGMHLSPEFGLTINEIHKDGFFVDDKIEILLNSDTPVGTSKSMGLAMISFAETYSRLQPDIIVVLGDRFEIFSAVASAHVNKIPVAHIAGGEITEGAFDDAFRHSITKMSQIHFASTEDYKKRVIQMGEEPSRVHNVGALGIDNIKQLSLLSKFDLEKVLGFKFGKYNILVTFHPVTLDNTNSLRQFMNLLEVLDEFDDMKVIFTKSNADPGGKGINALIDKYVMNNFAKSIMFSSMGQLNYLSTMQFVDAVVGNSSSGIVEAPSFKIGTINIGDRQKGRIKASTIIDCDPSKGSIRKGFDKLYEKDFQKNLKSLVNPYGTGKTAVKIKSILKNIHIKSILKKSFYNIDFKWKEQWKKQD